MNTLNQFLIYTSQKFGDLEAYAWAQGDDIVSKTYAEFRDDAAKMADFMLMIKQKLSLDAEDALFFLVNGKKIC